MVGLSGPRMPPANGGKPSKLVIFAHGYGSNGEDLIGLAPYWTKLLPDAAFVSPNAPEPVPGYPSGYQWFSLGRPDPSAVAAGARGAASTLDHFIDAELARYQLEPRACALVGFSQGTMMSLHVGLRRSEPLAAIVGFSGLLPGAEALAREIRSRPPILLVHGDRDPVIPVQSMLAAVDGLARASAPCVWEISRGAAHTITQEALDLGGRFLRDAFAGRFAGWAPPVSAARVQDRAASS